MSILFTLSDEKFMFLCDSITVDKFSKMDFFFLFIPRENLSCILPSHLYVTYDACTMQYKI